MELETKLAEAEKEVHFGGKKHLIFSCFFEFFLHVSEPEIISLWFSNQNPVFVNKHQIDQTFLNILKSPVLYTGCDIQSS